VRRNKLFDVLNALRLNGECLEAHNWVLTELVRNHVKGAGVGWDSLDLQNGEALNWRFYRFSQEIQCTGMKLRNALRKGRVVH
jgi:hypothetical protein